VYLPYAYSGAWGALPHLENNRPGNAIVLIDWLACYGRAAILVGIPTTICAPRESVPSLYGQPYRPTLDMGAGIRIVGALIGIFIALKKKKELASFLCSVGFLVCILGSTAAGLYPNLLTSTLDPAYDLKYLQCAGGRHRAFK